MPSAPANRFVAVSFFEGHKIRQRILLLIAAVLILWRVVRGLASALLEKWWFDTVTDADVWISKVRSQAVLLAGTGALVAVVLGTSVWLVLKLGRLQSEPPNRAIQRYHERMGPAHRWLLVGIVVFFTYRIGVAAAGEWQSWLLFRHGGDLGVSTPVAGGDLGFHLFRLPFLDSASSFLRQLLLFTLAIAVLAHIASGALRSPWGTQRSSRVAVAHVAMLAAALLGVQALDDVLVARPSIATTRTGAFDGPGWTEMYVTKPGLVVCALVTMAAAFAAVWWARTTKWKPFAAVLGAAIVVQVLVVGVLPAFTERVIVNPAEASRQLWSIDANLDATRTAYELDGIVDEPISDPTVQPLATVEDADEAVLFDSSTMASAMQVIAGKTGTRVLNADVVLTDVDGVAQPIYRASRAANSNDLPETGWVQQYLVFTHGDGVVTAPANTVDADGRPSIGAHPDSFGFADTPVYFDESLRNWYAVVDTKREQVGGAVFEGEAIDIGSFSRRVVSALGLREPQLALSSELTVESQLVYRRGLAERIAALAPFLSIDSDPYLTFDGDSLVWVVDAYTTSSTVPYAQFANTNVLPGKSGLSGSSVNSVRASVRATIDAATGETHLYRTDGGTDPIIDAWSRIFPGLLEDDDSIPAAIVPQLRYPTDLWTIQSTLLGRYHVDDAEALFSGADRWAVSAAPATVVADTTVAPSPPVDQYAPSNAQFGSTLPYGAGSAANPTSTRDQLTALAVAEHGANETIHVATADDSSIGLPSPRVAQSAIDADPELARTITLLNANGSKVQFGPMAPLLSDHGLIWTRPIIVISTSTSAVPRLYGVAAVLDGLVSLEPTAADAVDAVIAQAGQH